MYFFTCFRLSSPPEGKQEEARDPGIVCKRHSVNNCWQLNENEIGFFIYYTDRNFYKVIINSGKGW